MKDLLRILPSVDAILNDKSLIKQLDGSKNRRNVVDAVRKAIDHFRVLLLNGIKTTVTKGEIIKLSLEYIKRESEYSLRRVVNGTGIVLHTNLGRAPLPFDIKNNLIDITTHYSTLEYDIINGKRGSRYSHVESLLQNITGAEAALVVNNNAAAVLLALSTIANGKEVIVSRGQLVEIGGSFRIPDVMRQSGSVLVEVGTTNKTHEYDYMNAINENTALILKVHKSNYKIIGFSEDVSDVKIKEIAQNYNIPYMVDLGSGTLLDLKNYDIGNEPTVTSCIKSGIDIVTFSGDKLLGGPQAGIILGKKKYVDLMKKNPLTRALRVDKMCLSSLEYILRIYLYGDPENNIPVVQMLTIKKEKLWEKAEKLKNILSNIDNLYVDILDIASMAGGGSLPGVDLPSYGVTIRIDNMTPNELEKKLRNCETPIIVRILNDNVIIDVRTIFEDDYNIIYNELKGILGDAN